uniref:Olfactory receptor 145 n=1 Tax=Aulacocentrum confusum TaxID=2767324 RepID=A0A7G8Z9G4_9HYME|nr:olfactory receptor 145 [Aulacocentrum confusum]
MTEWRNSDKVAILTYVMLLMSLCFNIFIFNFIGDELQYKFESMALSTYKSDWYQISGNGALPLVLTIAMSQSPPQLTAGGMITLNLPTFMTIIRTSVIYLNVLRTVTE